MAAFSKYVTAKNSSIAGGILLVLYLLKHRRRTSKQNSIKGGSNLVVNNEKDSRKDRAAVDKVFFLRTLQILRIMVPRVFCMETGYLILIAAMLVARTYCDVWMIQNGTMIESGIISRDISLFKKHFYSYISVIPGVTVQHLDSHRCGKLKSVRSCSDEFTCLSDVPHRFTARITELMSVLKELNAGKYERTMVSQQEKESDMAEKLTLVPGSGQIINKDNIIKFDHTPLATPNGDILIRDLTFEVRSGTNVLVCGPNGCGKSSLFRALGELWPLFGGQLTKPERGKLFYVPQRPYMTLGSLRDQVIYPDTYEDQRRKNISDQVLKEYLDNVQLGHILDREGSWDSVQDWMDVLSGGEKQRMAMARLFYHKPQFAILDECTSAVSVDVEDFIYSHCRTVGITLFTVSHRKSLWKHHKYYLHMDGRGNYEFKPITDETVEFGS
ncbi:ATP-binding cassette sub-family D member 3a [Micropterus dolomieu]|uniref:ATP-binding cassette sub-family D member 3a n=1 Tax=Micropterus dolomieu TaxID=147949 RepID=UPI001E8E418A|nr:ATP-binding cassette sub-family D member 3a [Micropterus dolomieu]